MAYEYNPLLKDCLQKKSAVSPEDIQHIEGEIATINENITDINGDLKNKVPKFFTSIEELEIGEIGEYQGETNETFTNGYFYKRLDGGTTPIFTPEYNITLVKYNGVGWIKNHSTEIHSYGDFFITSNELVRTDFESSNNVVKFNIRDDSHSETFVLFLFPFESGIISSIRIENDNLFKVNGVYNNGYLCEYAFDGNYNPCQIKIENGTISVFYLDTWNVVWINGYTTVYTKSLFYGYSFYYDKAVEVIIFDRALFIKSSILEAKNAFLTMAKLDDDLSQWEPIHEVALLNSVSYQTVPAFLRIDTQPSLDPDDFATAAQGTKADTALQSISKGTDGDYITTTVGAKDVNNKQTVAASVTIQDINAASESAKGLLEAWNARNYIDTQIYKVSLNFFFYGVQWDENDPSPDCVRVGNMSLHAELPIQNAIVGGLLQDDLTFTPFANQSDWSGETVDGSAGQVMVQIPQYYFKSEVHGTVHKKLVSQYPLAGFNKIPLMYISAEKATVDRTDPNTPKLCSVVNTTAAFRGGNNTADWDGTYRSLLGFPASNISLTNFRQYARNRGNGTTWNCHTYLAQRVLYWLFVTEYATLNSQKPYNAAKDNNGYAQGGLGPGVSNWNGNAWNDYNGYNPLIPCGYMLEYGNQSAVKNYSVKDADDNILVTFEVNSYHGIQSPFADIWDWLDGILINVQSDAAGGVSTCYVTDDPAKFSSTDFSQYREVGAVPRTENWIKTIYDGEAGDIICKSIPGSSTSYYCDYYWGLNLPASGVSLRGVHFGGRAAYGARCGFLYAASIDVPGHVHPAIGSRLCAFPSPLMEREARPREIFAVRRKNFEDIRLAILPGRSLRG